MLFILAKVLRTNIFNLCQLFVVFLLQCFSVCLRSGCDRRHKRLLLVDLVHELPVEVVVILRDLSFDVTLICANHLLDLVHFFVIVLVNLVDLRLQCVSITR